MIAVYSYFSMIFLEGVVRSLMNISSFYSLYVLRFV